MKNLYSNEPDLKPTIKKEKGNNSSGGFHFLSTGTCLGLCVECGALCCMNVGHRGPHFCYLCK